MKIRARWLSLVSLLIGVALFIYLLRQTGIAAVLARVKALGAGVIEVYTTRRLLGYPVTFVTAFILEAVNRVINIVFAFVPALIRVDKAGTGLLTNALRLDTGAGVTLAIIRKARMLVWIGLGLFFLWQPKTPSDKHDRL